MNNVVKRVLSTIMTIVFTVLMVSYASKILERKESDFKYRDFFEQEEDFDVLFLGSSHMINAVYPYELWDDYGIVSYNLGAHGASPAVSYWVLKNSLEYTTPKLVVLDCLYASWPVKIADDFEQIHKAFDAFPLNSTKYDTICDLVDANSGHNKMEMIWKFSLYHNRWNQFEPWDFTLPYNDEMGGETRIDLVTPLYFDKIDRDVKNDINSVSATYIKKTIEECQSKGIDIILVYLPFPADVQDQADANMLYDLAVEYQVDYINFLDENIVNYETDMYDEQSHLNPSGAKKVSNYIGQYIVDRYDIPNHKGDSGYSNWHSGFDAYNHNKQSNFMYETSPYIYMTLVADNSLSVDLEIINDEIYQDDLFNKLINNISFESAQETDNPYDYDVDIRLTVKDKQSGETIEKSLFNYNENGEIEFTRDYN